MNEAKRDIYLDNSATTRPSAAVREIVLRTMTEDFGNPSSMHRKGMDAERYIRESAEIISGILKVKPKELCFTSGGTEADNLAILGTAAAMKRRGRRILAGSTEHPAVSEPLKYLEKEGFEVIKIPSDRYGRPDPEAFRELLTEDTILVTVMYVNNEIGALSPIRELARLTHEMAPLALFHADAVQAFGKYHIYPKRDGIDLLSASGHKLHGPKGSGFLYISGDAHITPIIFGGGQMQGLRSGTENVSAIAGLGVAAREAYTDLDEKMRRIRTLKNRLREELAAMDGVILHGTGGEEDAPHIVNAAFTGVGSEVLLHSLEDRGIYVSAGSACSTHKRSVSPTLAAIGADREELRSSIRFSLSEDTTEEDIAETVKAISQLLPMLRRYRSY